MIFSYNTAHALIPHQNRPALLAQTQRDTVLFRKASTE